MTYSIQAEPTAGKKQLLILTREMSVCRREALPLSGVSFTNSQTPPPVSTSKRIDGAANPTVRPYQAIHTHRSNRHHRLEECRPLAGLAFS